MFYAVIGNNYGDEGKGLAVDYLTLSGRALVVRHNGGAQAGHSVDREEGRFVFHELSSGSFNGADTYWTDTFFPDLYKLEEEIEEFSSVYSGSVKIYASPACNAALVYDAYLNQKREEMRCEKRHGSCGMGIWEAVKRSDRGYGISLAEISSLSVADIARKLKMIEEEYMASKYGQFSIGEPLELDTLKYASILKDSLHKYVTLAGDEKKLLTSYDNVIFEGGQGLMLDTAREDLWPHTTCSRTNISNPLAILQAHGLKLDEAVYVTRTYQTRHGAGPFKEDPELKFADETNIPNPWQGSLRFGRFESLSSLIGRAAKDVKDNCPYNIRRSLFVTHLNETGEKILVEDKDVSLEEFKKAAAGAGIDRIYLSSSKLSKEVRYA